LLINNALYMCLVETSRMPSKMWYMQTMEYYSPWKRMDYLAWTITLSERSQAQKATYYMVLFTWSSQNRQIQRERSFVVARVGKNETESGCSWWLRHIRFGGDDHAILWIY
jgi:hypothetical protein